MGVVLAEPFEFVFDPASIGLVVIDMQRDFIEPGGFGASLGNDVSLLQAIVPTVARLIGGFRAAGLPVIHTRECHLPASSCDRACHVRAPPMPWPLVVRSSVASCIKNTTPSALSLASHSNMR